MLSRAVLFDLDGVIIDSSSFHYESWVQLGNEVGFVMTPQLFKETFGQRNDAILRRLKPDIIDEQIENWGERKEELYRKLASGKLKPLKGVVKLVFGLKQHGFQLAVVSSTPLINIIFALEQIGLGEDFDTIVSAEDVREGKPNPEPFLKAAERLGVKPSRCVVVEDAVAGVEAAKRGKMKCIAVTTTNPPERLKCADLLVNDLEELTVDQIAQLLEAGEK